MSAPVTAAAAVPTAHASRYLQQLAKHWSHRFAVEFDAERATIPFDNGAVARLAAGAETLEVTVAAPDAALLDRMKQVVAEHLDRFAFREAPLAFDWR